MSPNGSKSANKTKLCIYSNGYTLWDQRKKINYTENTTKQRSKLNCVRGFAQIEMPVTIQKRNVWLAEKTKRQWEQFTDNGSIPYKPV